jgi:hypothetical protein
VAPKTANLSKLITPAPSAENRNAFESTERNLQIGIDRNGNLVSAKTATKRTGMVGYQAEFTARLALFTGKEKARSCQGEGLKKTKPIRR